MLEYESFNKDVLGKTRITSVKTTEVPMCRNEYGNKIPTRYMVKIGNKPQWHRVYAIQYSNNGSLYILENNDRLFISIDGEHKIKENN